MNVRPAVRSLLPALVGGTALATAGVAAAGPTNLQMTEPLVWVMIAISVAGTILTWGVMVYALWKFRDPAARRRRYG